MFSRPVRRRLLVSVLAVTPAAFAESPSFSGTTGLLATPTAEVQRGGTARVGWSQQDFRSVGPEPLQNYYLTFGFLPGLEVGGRIVEDNAAIDISTMSGSGRRDLSFNAKYRLDLPAGIGLAVGGEDIGGEAQFFRTSYAVATLPWRSLSFTAGYGLGPDVLDGAFGGVEWRPWEFVGLVAEHDTEDFNGGVKLASPALLYGMRLGATAAYRGVTEEVEYGAHLEIPLGGRKEIPRSSGSAPASSGAHGAPYAPPAPSGAHGAPYAPHASDTALRAALARHGFESLRVGRRGPATQVVALENRVYNHSSADAVGLALGAIATHADPAVEHIELTLFAYGMPQVAVTVPAALYRAFLQDPAAHEAALRQALAVRNVDGIAEGVAWDSDRYQSLNGMELVVEPILRSFLATELGLIDYSLGARLRLTLPMSGGFLMHLGGQVPLVESDDFGPGDNFESTGVEAGLDLALAQYAHKLSPQWTWLWSAGRSQIFQTDLNTLALEQFWLSAQGTHQLRGKMMALHSATRTRTVALAGYTWFDPGRDYSLSLTGGRFYAGDAGFRLDLTRHFGDTMVTLFFKAASRDDQAGGLQLSLPLTPRRDMTPGALQVKGARRWAHQQSTTLNAADGTNTLKPLLLYEPMLDLDLRRDLHDSGRLGEAYLRDELPRMHEAYRLWD